MNQYLPFEILQHQGFLIHQLIQICLTCMLIELESLPLLEMNKIYHNKLSFYMYSILARASNNCVLFRT